jgi:Superinfection immunity protein/Uncharacterised protein family UPF0547
MNFGSSGVLFGMALAGAVAAVYLMPVMIAGVRGHHRLRLVSILTIFFGWTVIGWVVGFIVACTPKREREEDWAPVEAEPPHEYEHYDHSEPDTKTCPACAETVKAAARLCRFCRYEFEPVLHLTRTAPAEQPAVGARELIRATRQRVEPDFEGMSAASVRVLLRRG